jgi:addiction module RelE/StbE family toxin
MISGEQFHPDELASIQAGLEEFEAGQLEFEHPATATEKLKELWQLDDSGLRVFREKVVRYLPGEPEWYLGMSDEFTKAIPRVDRKLQGRVLEAISHISREPTSPRGNTVKPLTGDLKGLWRYRIGDYRIVYFADSKSRRIVLIALASRGSVYA